MIKLTGAKKKIAIGAAAILGIAAIAVPYKVNHIQLSEVEDKVIEGSFTPSDNGRISLINDYSKYKNILFKKGRAKYSSDNNITYTATKDIVVENEKNREGIFKYDQKQIIVLKGSHVDNDSSTPDIIMTQNIDTGRRYTGWPIRRGAEMVHTDYATAGGGRRSSWRIKYKYDPAGTYNTSKWITNKTFEERQSEAGKLDLAYKVEKIDHLDSNEIGLFCIRTENIFHFHNSYRTNLDLY